MSEFSESFHFATSDLAALKSALEDAKLTGQLFGPSETGWITYVPFDGCPGYQPLASHRGSFAADLSRRTGHPTLEWIYCEDHMWSAILWRNGQIQARYAGDWDDEPSVETDGQSLARFQELPGRPGAKQQIADALPGELDEDALMASTPHAYRFAEALGLPEYQWLSAMYATMDAAGGDDEREGTKLEP
jgi:hypothetical protein